MATPRARGVRGEGMDGRKGYVLGEVGEGTHRDSLFLLGRGKSSVEREGIKGGGVIRGNPMPKRTRGVGGGKG